MLLAPPNRVTVNGSSSLVDFLVEAEHGERLSVRIVPPSGQALAPGTYNNGQSYPGQPPGAPALDSPCSPTPTRFVVREATYNADGSIASFALDFECPGYTAP